MEMYNRTILNCSSLELSLRLLVEHRHHLPGVDLYEGWGRQSVRQKISQMQTTGRVLINTEQYQSLRILIIRLSSVPTPNKPHLTHQALRNTQNSAELVFTGIKIELSRNRNVLTPNLQPYPSREGLSFIGVYF
jgi:hypothetical protein